MSVELGESGYGKGDIRVLCVSKVPAGEDVAEAVIRVLVKGGIEESYLLGDNARVVTTDAQRNLVLATLRAEGVSVVEDAAVASAEAMRRQYGYLPEVSVEVSVTSWRPISNADGVSGPAFCAEGVEHHRARASASAAGGTSLVSGWQCSRLALTRGSRFVGFMIDQHTPNGPQEDRAIAGKLDVEWVVAGSEADHMRVRTAVRSTLLDVFDRFRSESVQHLLTVMCRHVLDRVPEVLKTSLRLESTALTEVVGKPPGPGMPGAAGQLLYVMSESPRAETWVSLHRAGPGGGSDGEVAA